MPNSSSKCGPFDPSNMIYVTGWVIDPIRGKVRLEDILRGTEFVAALLGDRMFVLPHIWDRIEEFDNRDGYAGFTLVEYLRKLGYGTEGA